MGFAFLFADWLGTPAWLWLAFLAVVAALLALDLGVLSRGAGEIPASRSLWMSAFYTGIACAFGAWVWWRMGAESGMAYFTGFAVEKTLALDNVFVVNLIFAYFAIPRPHQHRVLFWGILGVIVLRAIMIGLGAALVSEFSWVLYVFGAFLLATGAKMLLVADSMPKIEDNPVLRLVRRRFRVTTTLHGGRFLVRLPDPRTGRMATWLTPLFLALVLVGHCHVEGPWSGWCGRAKLPR